MSVQRRSERTRDDVPNVARGCESIIPHPDEFDSDEQEQKERDEWVAHGKDVTIGPSTDQYGAVPDGSEMWIETNGDDLVYLEENR